MGRRRRNREGGRGPEVVRDRYTNSALRRNPIRPSVIRLDQGRDDVCAGVLLELQKKEERAYIRSTRDPRFDTREASHKTQTE